ncbi:sulfurtransferase [Alkalilacustris brevis]|uniref:sulfurtransferase n=1 Tax=Alkalilacustris brevis TaxID=2026338 RepID=UPI000E0D51B3|nr:rhodanese-like domain-containing protein [Alkalilacustris brevis]
MTDPFIDARDLGHLGPIQLLDARDSDAQDVEGAPAGSIRVPLDEWNRAVKEEATALDQAAPWTARLDALGLDRGATAVVFDEGGMTAAARVWFILQYFGLPVRLLNGGLPALKAAEALPALTRPATGGALAEPKAPGSGAAGLVDRHALRAALGQVNVFDTRSAAEFSGEDMRSNPRGGHLRGSHLLPHGELMDAAGQVHPAATLRPMLEKAGFAEGDAIVTMCQGGGRAALGAAAALRAGYGDVRVYYLSFGDWAADESCPLER